MRKDILTAFLYISILKSYLYALPPCLELNFTLNTFTLETYPIGSPF